MRRKQQQRLKVAGEPHTIHPWAVYSTRALMLALRVGGQTIREAVKHRHLHCKQLGNRHFFLGEWILDWLRREDSDAANAGQ